MGGFIYDHIRIEYSTAYLFWACFNYANPKGSSTLFYFECYNHATA